MTETQVAFKYFVLGFVTYSELRQAAMTETPSPKQLPAEEPMSEIPIADDLKHLYRSAKHAAVTDEPIDVPTGGPAGYVKLIERVSLAEKQRADLLEALETIVRRVPLVSPYYELGRTATIARAAIDNATVKGKP